MKIEFKQQNDTTEINVYQDHYRGADVVEMDVSNVFSTIHTCALNSTITMLSKSDAHKLGTELIRLSDAL
jgi:hypothetical protein